MSSCRDLLKKSEIKKAFDDEEENQSEADKPINRHLVEDAFGPDQVNKVKYEGCPQDGFSAIIFGC